MFKIVTLLFTILSVLMTGPSRAETIKLKRGLPTDIWISWPDGERFSEPALVSTFPEYRQVFKGDEFKLAREAGFDFIRLTVDPAIFLWQASPERTTTLLKGVKAAIDDIRNHGLKVLVDLHSIPRSSGAMGTEQILASNEAFERYLVVVADVARVVAEYPQAEVGFEPLNEPTIDCPWDRAFGTKPRWPALLKKLHGVARAAAPDTTLVLSGACWGSAIGLTQVNPARIKDQNILWSFHAYEPFLFTHQGASWSGGHYQYAEGLRFPPKTADKRRLLKIARQRLEASKAKPSEKSKWRKALTRDFNDYFKPGFAQRAAGEPFDSVARWAKRHGLPANRILLGEFGAIRGDLSPQLTDLERSEYIAAVRQQAEKQGFAWATWSWTGSFGISSSPDSRTFSPLLLQALGLP